MEENIKNSEAYLNSVLEKENNFSTPKNYFDNIENNLFVALLEENIPKKKAFSTPDSYFETLEDVILDKVVSRDKPAKVLSLKQRLYKIMPTAVAASVVLIISINYFTKINNNVTFDTLADSDIESWIINNATTMTSQDIASFIAVDDIDINDFEYTTINNDDIEDYIIQNDNTTLLNEIN